MRVAFYGNICNNFFQIASAVRKLSDIDAHLYLDEKHDAQMRPESDDPQLRGGYPGWIHAHRYVRSWTRLTPWRSPLIAELARADVVVVSGLGPMLAQFVDKPMCFFVTGGDLNVLPFPLEYLHDLGRGWRSRAAILADGFWQRRGVRRADEIWTQMYSPYLHSIDRLGIDRARLTPAYFPVVVDTDLFRRDPMAAASTEPWARAVMGRDFVVFHPSRIMIKGNPRLHPARHAVLVKRNEVLFEGFARFLQERRAHGAVLVMPDREASPDTALARRILQQLGIDRQVIWLTPPRSSGFTRAELVALYSLSDVVADDFGVGWFGGVALEALSMGLPLVSYIDEAVMSGMYPSHPILSARTAEGVAHHLGRLHEDAALRARLGAEGRAWVLAHHAHESAGRVYVQRFAELAHRLGLPAPRLRGRAPADANASA